jgi:hypothetical protein
MDVAIYIKGQRLDLFNDENIYLNLNAKNLSDISSIIADFSQSFSVPASPNNNKIFEYWYNSDVDGSFNANIRQEAYIEINTLPFKFGTMQLDNAILKDGLANSYAITFFGKAVNLTDLFADDLLSSLNFTTFNHPYNSATVLQAMNSDSINGGDIYYPFINANNDMSIGTNDAKDLINASNTIVYTDFKPAIRCIRIIEAIETKYDVKFTRDFFDRAVFYNLFFWLHKEAGSLKAFGNKVDVNITDNKSVDGFLWNATTNTVTYNAPSGTRISRQLTIQVTPQAGFETIPYIIEIYNNGSLYSTNEGLGISSAVINQTGDNVVSFKISSSSSFNFTTKLTSKRRETFYLAGVNNDYEDSFTPLQSITSTLDVASQFPEMKVKEFLNSLISMFNLIIKYDNDKFIVDTLDNWYSKGKSYDITQLVDVSDIRVKRPDVKKQIEFMYKKTGAILGEQYQIKYNVGYGDLKVKYNVDGQDLKVEAITENMLFERLQNEATGDLSDVQVGFSIDKNLKPYKGATYLFYKNGYVYSSTPLKVKPTGSFTKIQHTATEDNIDLEQVTNSLNFGAENSTFFLNPIQRGLYFNFWKTYIEDLYNKKTRIISFKCKIPVNILYQLRLNDRFIVNDKKYKISTAKVDLTNYDADVELFSDFSKPFDSVENLIPITVDRTDITADNSLLTVDRVSEYDPVTSYTTNGLSANNYLGTASQEHFEVKVSANTTWSIAKVNVGNGTSWFTCNKFVGDKSDYIRVTLSNNTASYREAILRMTVGGVDYDLLIQQQN